MRWRGVWLRFLISGERVDSSEEAEDLVFLLSRNWPKKTAICQNRAERWAGGCKHVFTPPLLDPVTYSIIFAAANNNKAYPLVSSRRRYTKITSSTTERRCWPGKEGGVVYRIPCNAVTRLEDIFRQKKRWACSQAIRNRTRPFRRFRARPQHRTTPPTLERSTVKDAIYIGLQPNNLWHEHR